MKEELLILYKKVYRLIILPSILLGLAYLLLTFLPNNGHPLSLITEPWCVALVLMIINHIYLEHLFTSPRYALVNSLNALIIALSLLLNAGPLTNFWIILIYSSIVFVSGLVLILSYERFKKMPRLIRFMEFFGKSKVIFPFVAFMSFLTITSVNYTISFNIDYSKMIYVAAFYLIFIILTAPKIIEWFRELPSKIFKIIYAEDFGVVTGCLTPNIVLVKFGAKSNVNINDLVIFGEKFESKDFTQESNNLNNIGLILDFIGAINENWMIQLRVYLLNEPYNNACRERIFNVKLGTECHIVKNPEILITSINQERISYTWHRRNDIVGIISPMSKINIIKAEIIKHRQLANAELVSLVNIDSEKLIRYQIIEAETFRESNDEKHDHGFTQLSAYQLGKWAKPNNDKSKFHRFIEFPWVPNINTLVFKWNDQFDEIDIDEKEVDKNGFYLLGTIPNTKLPIYINVRELVSHHTAILGVTGSGKSTLVFKLLNQISSNNILTICLDITGEYKNKLGEFEPFLDTSCRTKWGSEIAAISEIRRRKSLAFGDVQRLTPEDADKQEHTHVSAIDKIISARIDDLRKLKRKVIFEILEISNTKISIDCTQYFLQGLLEYSKAIYENNLKLKPEDRDQYQCCLVLEEAHTIIPENIGVGGRYSESQSIIDKISQIALQGRKYNVGFLIISQRTATVKKTVLNQCNTMISFRAYDETSFNFLSSYFGDEYVKEISHLKNDGNSRYVIVAGKALISDRPIIVEIKKD